MGSSKVIKPRQLPGPRENTLDLLPLGGGGNFRERVRCSKLARSSAVLLFPAKESLLARADQPQTSRRQSIEE